MTTQPRKFPEPLPVPNTNKRPYTQSEMMDGMILWEAMMSAYQQDKDDATQLAQVWLDMGAYQMRQYASELIDDLNRTWEIVCKAHDDLMIFDWEFAPAFVHHLRWTYSEGEHATFISVDSDPERIASVILMGKALDL